MRRRIGFLFICSAAVPIAVFAATAWGCGTLVTLSATPKVATPNQLVTVTGRHWGSTPTNTNVDLRWNSRTGTVVKTVTPAELVTGVQVPAPAAPGWYVLTGTQFNSTTGVAKTGSPGRTTLRVQGGAASSSTSPWGAAAKPTGSGGPGSPDVPLPGILLSAALLATGLTLVARGRGKKATRPVLGA